MWYGRLATTSYGWGTSRVSGWSSASPSISRSEPGPAPRSSAVGEPLAQAAPARPRSSSTAVTVAPAVEQAAGQEPEPGADLEDRAGPARARPRPGSPRGRRHRPGSSGRASGGRAAPPARSGPADGRPDRAGRAAGLSDGRGDRLDRTARGRLGRASRSRPARTPARKRRAAGGPDHRPVVGAQRRAAGRWSGRPSAAASAASRSARTRFAATPPPTHDRAGADRPGGPRCLAGEHVDHRVLEPHGQLGHDRSGRAPPAHRPAGRPRRRAASMIRRAAVFRPLKLKSR